MHIDLELCTNHLCLIIDFDIHDLKIQTSAVLWLSFALFFSWLQLLPPNEICTHTKLFHQSFIKKHSLPLRTAAVKIFQKYIPRDSFWPENLGFVMDFKNLISSNPFASKVVVQRQLEAHCWGTYNQYMK